jgi:hypothetical protein
MCHVWSWASTSTIWWSQLKSKVGELDGMEFLVFGYRMFLDHFENLFKEKAKQMFDHKNFLANSRMATFGYKVLLVQS